MDTREKIVPLERLHSVIASDAWAAVAGLFDPLTAAQATRLAEIGESSGRRILAVVIEDEHALLPAEARACLVAGLREVHAVVIANSEEWRVAIQPDSHIDIIDDVQAEKTRTAEFIQWIHMRQQSAEAGAGQLAR